MRSEVLVESCASPLRLSAAEAEALRHAGRRLASDRTWWGNPDEPLADRSIIRCQRLDSDTWHVTVLDAVGTIVVGDSLQLIVVPKIPESHLLYLFHQSDVFPRVDEGQGTGAVHTTLWELVAEWSVRATERVLRQDLRRDYETCVDELSSVRGTLATLETAGAYYAGRLAYVCEFDEFGVDSPLNRVVKAAAAVVLSAPALVPGLRRRARAIVLRMSEVGALRPHDVHVAVDRTSARYADAVALALQVLKGAGRALSTGTVKVWTFLVRTPELVEAGIRSVLQRAIGEQAVIKRGLRLAPSTMTLNPDLVFGDGRGVADVKYKTATEDWRRADLYQVVTFATGYRTTRAAMIDFLVEGASPLADLQIGEVSVRHLSWPAAPTLSPEQAASVLADAVKTWLPEC